MSITEDRRYSSQIVSIDPSSLVSYAYSKNEIKLNKLEKSDKNAFFISYLYARDMILVEIFPIAILKTLSKSKCMMSWR